MLLEPVVNLLLTYWYLVLSVVVLGYLVKQRYHNGLSQYPGPFLASVTDLWRALHLWKTRAIHDLCVDLHREHGDIVRLGPNLLSFGNPKAIKDIYGLNKGFVKSGYYPVQAATNKGHAVLNLFSTTDEDYHAKLRRCVNHAFSMSTLLSYEPLVSSSTVFFLQQTLERFVKPGESVDFAHWLQYYAFDVIGELAWSKRLGFVEKNKDIDGIIAQVDWTLDYGVVVGQAPWTDKLLVKNPISLWFQKLGLSSSGSPAANFANRRQSERVVGMDKAEKALPEVDEKRGVDFLTRFLQAQKDHPEFMDDTRVLAVCLSLILAGSDSTAISLSNIFHNLVMNPRVYRKLVKEVDEAANSGKLYADNATSGTENEVFSFNASQSLPYLDAVITEAFRIYPAVGIVLERVVPPSGANIAGTFVPGGTIVGCNAWVLHRHQEIFGDDVEEFRPERWLESEGADPQKVKEMRATMFHFGAGSRTCIGKNISLMEIYKVIPSFLRRFDVTLADPSKSIQRHNAFFVRINGFEALIKERVPEKK